MRCVWRQIGDTFKSLEIYPVDSVAPFIHLSNSVLSATMDNTIHAATYVQYLYFLLHDFPCKMSLNVSAHARI